MHRHNVRLRISIFKVWIDMFWKLRLHPLKIVTIIVGFHHTNEGSD
jgi:hypothetical protein